ncbi:amino acid ABC transporter permease [Paenibacillus filicis]|uniref:Amino acid ABC transporter permease n=1 Tax=Paenibacillus filicis TaxID=669464 RepID=A0ABU9DTP6_9BACL
MQTSIDLVFIWQTMGKSLRYLPATLMLSFVPFLISFVVGTLFALARMFNVPVVARFCSLYIVVVRGIPVVLLLFICYYAIYGGIDALAKSFDLSVHSKDLSPLWIAIIALSVNGTVYLAETMRSALMAVDRGQMEAAYSVGMSTFQGLRRAVFPQALPKALPNLCNNLTATIKSASLAFTISVVDLLNGALLYASSNYKYLEAYIAAAILYWLLCYGIDKSLQLLERRVNLKTERTSL